ncbi:hypothetical protein JVU11DRAFT_8680 [Chiua virens]|nr:hypothetical protein JVU11DRAFT_8680 [Chiua virens]
MYHIRFLGPTIALDRPVTEVTILTLKAPENHEALVDILSKVSETTAKMLVFGRTTSTL